MAIEVDLNLCLLFAEGALDILDEEYPKMSKVLSELTEDEYSALVTKLAESFLDDHRRNNVANDE